MNNTFPLKQKSETGIPDVNLILRHYKLFSMSRFVENKSVNRKLNFSEKAKKIELLNFYLKTI